MVPRPGKKAKNSEDTNRGPHSAPSTGQSSWIITSVQSSPAILTGWGAPHATEREGVLPGEGARAGSGGGGGCRRRESGSVPRFVISRGDARRSRLLPRGHLLLSRARQARSHPSEAGSFLPVFTKVPHPFPRRKDAWTGIWSSPVTWPDFTPARVWGVPWEPGPSSTPLHGPEPGLGPHASSSVWEGASLTLCRGHCPEQRAQGTLTGLAMRWGVTCSGSRPRNAKGRGELGHRDGCRVLPQGSAQVCGDARRLVTPRLTP